MYFIPYFLLTLTLLMARIGANNPNHAFPANDSAVFTNAANGTADFHNAFFFFVSQKEFVY